MSRKQRPIMTENDLERLLELGVSKGYFFKSADGRYTRNPDVPTSVGANDPDIIALEQEIANSHDPGLN